MLTLLLFCLIFFIFLIKPSFAQQEVDPNKYHEILISMPKSLVAIRCDTFEVYDANSYWSLLFGEKNIESLKTTKFSEQKHFLDYLKAIKTNFDFNKEPIFQLKYEANIALINSSNSEIPMVVSPFAGGNISGIPVVYFFADRVIPEALIGFRKFLSTFSDSVFYMDNNGLVKYCNQAFEKTFKTSFYKAYNSKATDLNLPKEFLGFIKNCISNLSNSTDLLCYKEKVVLPGKILTAYDCVGFAVNSCDKQCGIFISFCDVSLEDEKIDALNRQQKLLRTANEIVQHLLVEAEGFDHSIRKVLEFVASDTSADFVDVWRNHESSDKNLLCTQVYMFSNLKVAPEASLSTTVDYNKVLPTWFSLLSNGKFVDSQKHEMVDSELLFLQNQGLTNIFVVPIFFHTYFWGFLRIGYSKDGYPWSIGEETILQTIGVFIAGAVQQRYVQNALTESEERFRDVSLATGEIIWELDSNGYFKYISERAAELVGFAPSSLIGQQWEVLAIDPDGELITGEMFQAALEDGWFRGLTHAVRGKDGEPLWLFSSARLLMNENGISGMRGTSLDISKERQMRQNLQEALSTLAQTNVELEESVQRANQLSIQAEEASKAKSEFIATMSHELRTPLNTVIGMSHLVAKAGLNPAQKEYIHKVQDAAMRLLAIVNAILDFSAIESGNFVFISENFYFETLCNQLIGKFYIQAEKKNLKLAWRIAPNIPKQIYGDIGRLEQLIGNILDNSIKFTDKGSVTIDCSVVEAGDTACTIKISIVDTGIGVEESDKDMLFKTFSQIDASLTRKHGGTGLGLVVTKRLVELMGGELVFESEAKRGTSVHIIIPFVVPNSSSDMEKLPYQNQHVALCMAPGFIRKLCATMLQDSGAEVTVFDSLADACDGVLALSESSVPVTMMFLEQESILEQYPSHSEKDEALGFELDLHAKVLPAVIIQPSWGQVQKYADSLWLDVVYYRAPLYSVTLLQKLAQVSEIQSLELEDDFTTPSFENVTVLVVEDSMINQQIVESFLEDTGARVEIAENGLEAISKVERAGFYDLIFMDIEMPEMDGYEACAAIKSNKNHKNIPIIAMTAHNEPNKSEKASNGKFDGYIHKPINIKDFFKETLRWIPKTKQKLPENKLQPGARHFLPQHGLDIDGALARLNNNVDLYVLLLKKFITHYTNIPESLKSDMLAGDPEAVRLVHTIKGLAGSLGASALSEAGLILEEHLNASSSASINEPFIESFLSELQSVIKILLQWESGQSQEVSSDEEFDACALLEECKKLEILIEDDDADACNVYNTLSAPLQSIDNNAAHNMKEHLDMFEFSEALEYLKPLLEKLEKLCNSK